MELRDLPERYRNQVAAKYAAQNRHQSQKQRSKYNNVRTEVSGIQFDSKKEAKRYEQLVGLLRAGLISRLKLQPEFTLVEGYRLPSTGEYVRPEKYRADFSYIDHLGNLIVEDVKSEATKTQLYKNKKKQLYEIRGIEIQEV